MDTMASLVEAQTAVLDVREVWFSNMHLLGFNSALSEERYKLTLEKDMFEHINKKGSEAVLHFLFSKLNPQLSNEVFRDCWPVYDKKLEQLFRKACSNWLARIAKEEPHSKLPRLAASLLLSPGGDKFYLLLLRLTTYILKLACSNEAKSIGKHLFLSSFVTSSKGYSDIQPGNAEVALLAMRAHAIRHCKSIQQRAHLTCALHKEWERYASQLTTEYRVLTKDFKTLTKKLLSLEEEQKHRVSTIIPQHPSGNRAKDDHVLSLTVELASRQRNARISKVREMWSVLKKFIELSSYQQEVVDNIVEGKVDMYEISARDIAFQLDLAAQIPEIIVQECEALSREGASSNTYHAGKLNLMCLIEMWRCSYDIIKTKLLRGGFPDCEQALSRTNARIQAHRTHFAAAASMRGSLSGLKTALEQSVQELEFELVSRGAMQCSMHGRDDSSLPLLVPDITIPSLGLELLPPSPVKTRTSRTPDHRMGKVVELRHPTENVSTPDAVRDISFSIHQTSLLRHDNFPSRIPTTAKMRTTSDLQSDGILSKTWSGRNRAHETGNGHQSQLRKAVKSEGVDSNGGLSTSGVRKSVSMITSDTPSAPYSNEVRNSVSMTTSDANGVGNIVSMTTSDAPSTPYSNGVRNSVSVTTSNAPSTPYSNATTNTSHSNGVRNSVSMIPSDAPSQLKDIPHAHELLADQIAAAVASLNDSGDTPSEGLPSPSGQLHSVVDTVSAMGKVAFISRDNIPRTPLSGTSATRTPLSGTSATRTPLSGTRTLLSGTSATRTPLSGHVSLEDEQEEEEEGVSVQSEKSLLGRFQATSPAMYGHVQLNHTPNGYSSDHTHSTSETPKLNQRSYGHTPEMSQQSTPLFTSATPKLTPDFSSSGQRSSGHTSKMSQQSTPLFTSATPTLDFSSSGQRSSCHTSKMSQQSTPLFTSATPTLDFLSSGQRSSGHTSKMSQQSTPLFTSATPTMDFSSSGQRSPDHASKMSTPLHYSHRTNLPSPVIGTPSQTMSLLQDIQPPTPFQHAVFDLDTPEDQSFSQMPANSIVERTAPGSDGSGSHLEGMETSNGNEAPSTPLGVVGTSSSVVDTSSGVVDPPPSPPGVMDPSPSPPGVVDPSPSPPGVVDPSPSPPGVVDPSPSPSPREVVDTSEVGPLLDVSTLDISTLGEYMPSPLIASTSHQGRVSNATPLTAPEAHSSQNPWFAGSNSKSSGLELFGDMESPELVSLSGSESPELTLSQDT